MKALFYDSKMKYSIKKSEYEFEPISDKTKMTEV